jgi:hypothetical protein
MKKVLSVLALATAFGGSIAQASNVDFNVGINIGTPPRIAVPVPVPPPVYAPPVVIEEPPEFIAPPQLGFYAAIGVPYDLFLIDKRYYLNRDNVWYTGPSYNGPWVSVRYKSLPWSLRRHPYERVRYYRDSGYRDYRHSRSPYWEKHHYHPRKEWRDERKAIREDWKHERKAEREEWKRDRHEAREHDRRHGRDD